MKTGAAGTLLAACVALFAACDLNPQPLPPGEQADAAANAPGSGGASSGGGSSSGGSDTGGDDSGVTGATDAGERADALPPPGDGGTPVGDSGADADAAEDAGADATSTDAGDAALD